jgi:ribosomal protein L40E
MAKKKLGHVELQWTCPNCGGLNPGPEKHCGNCGAPQPEDVKFEQAARQELITDEEKIEQAEAGADIHCPYCGSRNRAGAEVCHKCGGDLEEGVRRESGRIVGAYKIGPVEQVTCPHCGAENPDTNKTCVQCGGSLAQESMQAEISEPTKKIPNTRIWIIAAVLTILILACGAYFYFANRTNPTTGVVENVEWNRSVPIEALVPVEHKDWEDEIPSEGEILSCTEEVRNIQDEPAPNSVEICGTPYTVDSGGGYGDVVQDCEYQVYDSFCTYTLEEWSVVEVSVLSGNDLLPLWPEPNLDDNQRIGEEWEETYTIVFKSGDETYVYTISDFDLFQSLQFGSEWTLNINAFGQINSIEQR